MFKNYTDSHHLPPIKNLIGGAQPSSQKSPVGDPAPPIDTATRHRDPTGERASHAMGLKPAGSAAASRNNSLALPAVAGAVAAQAAVLDPLIDRINVLEAEVVGSAAHLPIEQLKVKAQHDLEVFGREQVASAARHVAHIERTIEPGPERDAQIKDVMLRTVSNMTFGVLKARFPSLPFHRLQHSIGVGNGAERFGTALGISPVLAHLAGDVHDIYMHMPGEFGKFRTPGFPLQLEEHLQIAAARASTSIVMDDIDVDQNNPNKPSNPIGSEGGSARDVVLLYNRLRAAVMIQNGTSSELPKLAADEVAVLCQGIAGTVPLLPSEMSTGGKSVSNEGEQTLLRTLDGILRRHDQPGLSHEIFSVPRLDTQSDVLTVEDTLIKRRFSEADLGTINEIADLESALLGDFIGSADLNACLLHSEQWAVDETVALWFELMSEGYNAMVKMAQKSDGFRTPENLDAEDFANLQKYISGKGAPPSLDVWCTLQTDFPVGRKAWIDAKVSGLQEVLKLLPAESDLALKVQAYIVELETFTLSSDEINASLMRGKNILGATEEDTLAQKAKYYWNVLERRMEGHASADPKKTSILRELEVPQLAS